MTYTIVNEDSLAAGTNAYDETMRGLFAPIRQGEQAVYTSPVLAAGTHQLRVRVTGQHVSASAGAAISIDRAEVFTGRRLATSTVELYARDRLVAHATVTYALPSETAPRDAGG